MYGRTNFWRDAALGLVLGANLGTDLRRSVLGSMLGADLGTGFDRHKKGRHTRCLPVDQNVWLMSSLIEIPADQTHQIDAPIAAPDSRTPVYVAPMYAT